MNRRRSTPPPEPAAPSRVEIALGTHQVVVEAAEPMETTIAAALRLWKDTAEGDSGSVDQVGFGSAMVTDPVRQPLMGPEISMPHVLIPQQDTPEDRGK